MEFESELEPADELRQASDHKLEPGTWWDEEWLVGWRRAKATVMEAEKEVQQFAVSWTVAWARAEARTWAEAKATLGRGGEVKRGAAGALLLGETMGRSTCTGKG